MRRCFAVTVLVATAAAASMTAAAAALPGKEAVLWLSCTAGMLPGIYNHVRQLSRQYLQASASRRFLLPTCKSLPRSPACSFHHRGAPGWRGVAWAGQAGGQGQRRQVVQLTAALHACHVSGA